MKWVTANNLQGWDNERDCQDQLPVLIRKLALAEAAGITKISFPGGDAIRYPGWDGIIQNETATQKVPAGLSVWEIGTEKEPRQKANKDYAKRTAKPGTLVPAETTYIAITSRFFPNKEQWMEEKNIEGIWKEVILLDAASLEEWVEQYPIVGAWLGQAIGKHTEIITLDQFWETWSKGSKHAIPPSLVLAGRETQAKKLVTLLEGPPSQQVIGAATAEEVMAFIAASIWQAAPVLSEELFARTVIVDHEMDFRKLMVQKNPMVLIMNFEDSGLLNQAVRNGHHVLLVADVTARGGDTFVLPRLRKEGFEKALQEMGFSYDESFNLSKDSAQSLSVLRRLLQFVQNQRPDWAKGDHPAVIIPALLAGGWNENCPGDKQLLAALSGMEYETYIEKLLPWTLQKDPPVLKIGTVWKITSALDAWSILAQNTRRKDFDLLKQYSLLVLSELNPALELEPEKQMMAGLLGKKFEYSSVLKKGMLHSLVMIAVFGDDFNIQGMEQPQRFVDGIIKTILNGADGRKLCSVYRYLPGFAEAAPDVFLNEMEEALTNRPESICELFIETSGGLTPHSHHTGLLWALESLATQESYLLRVTLLLGKLSKYDNRVTITNTAMNSLREIYVPWYVQIDTPFHKRRLVLEKLGEVMPGTAWTLLMNLLPDHHGIAHPITRCNWRNNTTTEYEPTNAEFNDFNTFLVDWLTTHHQGNAEKLLALTKAITRLYLDDHRKVLDCLLSIRSVISDEDSFAIADGLREILDNHREHQEQDWAIPESYLLGIEEVFRTFEPQNPVAKHLHLFTEGGRYFDHEGVLEKMRVDAMQEMYQQDGLDAIMQAVGRTENARWLGYFLGHISISIDEQNKVLNLLASDDNTRANFAHWYIIANVKRSGEEWISTTVDRIQTLPFTSGQQAAFFWALPDSDFTFALLEKADPAVQKLFWSKADVWFNGKTEQQKQYRFEKMTTANRHLTLLEKASYGPEELTSEMIAAILYNAATIHSAETVHLRAHNVGRMFESLHKRNEIDEERMANLEVLYLAFLTDRHSPYEPVTLYRELETKPAFFVEVLSMQYREDEGPRVELSEEEWQKKHAMAKASRDLLNSWRTIPGIQPDGSVDEQKVRGWVTTVRELAEKANRLKSCDGELGKILSYFPKNNDAAPPLVICELIDQIGTDRLVSGFRVALRNQRGTYVKSAYEGGQQERNLAARFESMHKQTMHTWPKTSAIFKAIAEEYEYDAKRADEEAQIDELIR
ncbi:MAG: hypothetical protein HYU71_15715 [Bacteroidetes bacterium]|nr:hypothetical protein [Bacteroidota bacterium]